MYVVEINFKYIFIFKDCKKIFFFIFFINKNIFKNSKYMRENKLTENSHTFFIIYLVF